MSDLRRGWFFELNDEDKKIAADELGEDPKQTASRIESLRTAVLQMKHLASPTDDEFLLLFLRHAKFSQTKALQVLDNFIKQRLTDPYKEIYVNDGEMDEKTLRLHRDGNCIAIELLTKAGLRTLVLRTGLCDPNEMTVREVFRACLAGEELILRYPVTQIRGVQYIIDDANVTSGYYTQFLNPTTVKMCAAAFLDVIPCRMKGMHFINSPAVIQVIANLLKKLVSRKIASRIHIHSSLESLHAAVEPEILPTELGGTAGSYAELAAVSYTEVEKIQKDAFQKYTCFSYDETKKVEGSVPTESFRMLNLDD